MADDPGDYSEIADQRLDELQASDPDLYDDVLTICEVVFSRPSRARSMSTAVRTEDGVVMRLAVPARDPCKVFWTTEGPRIEAIFPLHEVAGGAGVGSRQLVGR